MRLRMWYRWKAWHFCLLLPLLLLLLDGVAFSGDTRGISRVSNDRAFCSWVFFLCFRFFSVIEKRMGLQPCPVGALRRAAVVMLCRHRSQQLPMLCVTQHSQCHCKGLVGVSPHWHVLGRKHVAQILLLACGIGLQELIACWRGMDWHVGTVSRMQLTSVGLCCAGRLDPVGLKTSTRVHSGHCECMMHWTWVGLVLTVGGCHVNPLSIHGMHGGQTMDAKCH
jgi:hypothetical protein